MTNACLLAALLVPAADPLPVGHRGLLLDAPEHTLAGYAACLELRVGFEIDVRRTSDGRLVCLHDPSVDRTTDGTGKLADLPFEAVRKLDAGGRFGPAFAGQRVPTAEEAFALLKARRFPGVVVAVDLKEPGVEADTARLAEKAGVLGDLVFIGRSIDNPEVRKALRAAAKEAAPAVLAQDADGLAAAIADADSAWVYARFVPTPGQAAAVREAGKRLFLSGPVVLERRPENWAKAREAGADVLLTDFPLDCRRGWRPAPAAPR